MLGLATAWAVTARPISTGNAAKTLLVENVQLRCSENDLVSEGRSFGTRSGLGIDTCCNQSGACHSAGCTINDYIKHEKAGIRFE